MASYRIPLRSLLACCVLVLAVPQPAGACGIDMRDYIQLRISMTEGEILHRVGPPDHESIVTGQFGAIIKRTWYYLPEDCRVDGRRWITEITFDGHGRVQALERYKP